MRKVCFSARERGLVVVITYRSTIIGRNNLDGGVGGRVYRTHVWEKGKLETVLGKDDKGDNEARLPLKRAAAKTHQGVVQTRVCWHKVSLRYRVLCTRLGCTLPKTRLRGDRCITVSRGSVAAIHAVQRWPERDQWVKASSK